jgi:hypothetical protein
VVVLSALGGELERYGAAVDRGVASRSAHDPRPLEERTRYEQSFRQCINLWEDREDVRPLTFHPRIAQIAAELVGVPALRLWHDQALYKEPGGRETDPHHDQPYWPLVETDTVTRDRVLEGADLRQGAWASCLARTSFGVKAFANIHGPRLRPRTRPEARAHRAEFAPVNPA